HGERVARLTALAAQGWETYGHGSFAEVTRQRAHDFVLLMPSLARMVPGILCMFVGGLWVARRGLLHDVVANRRLLARIFAVCLPLGLAVNGLGVLAHHFGAGTPSSWVIVEQVAIAFGGPLLCIGYASGLALLVARGSWRFAALQAAGRMALTNYLMQSFVC